MLYPKGTRKSMKELLSAHGVTVRVRTQFSCVHYSTFLRWVENGTQHSAYFTASCGHPFLSVDGKPIRVTMDEVLALGLVQEK